MGASVRQTLKRSRTKDPSTGPPHKAGKTAVRPSARSRDNSNNSLQVQECSFFKWCVSGITAVAATLSGSHIAAARTNGDIELRDKRMMWVATSVIHAEEKNAHDSVTALEFSNCGQYLFVAYLLKGVRILRLSADGVAHHTLIQPSGGAIWDISVDRSTGTGTPCIAIASDDGCVRIITPDMSMTSPMGIPNWPTDPAHYEVFALEKSAARVLSVCWAPRSNNEGHACVVCGDEDGGIRWLNSLNGMPYGKGKIPGIRGEKVMLWSLQLAKDGGEVICGDSRGLATIWSSSTKTMCAEIRIEGMRGALWSSTVVRGADEQEFVIFGSAGGGIGGVKKEGQGEAWAPLRAVQLHTHDVRGLCSLPDGSVMSGSIDSMMRLFSPSALVSKRSIPWIRPYFPCVGQSGIQFSSRHNLGMVRLRDGVELWTLSDGMCQPALLLRMILSSMSRDVRACALSRDCRSVAVSSADSFKAYQIWDGKGHATSSPSFGKVVSSDVPAGAEVILRGCFDIAYGDDFLACLTACRKRVVIVSGTSHCVASVEDFGNLGSMLTKLSCSSRAIAVCDSRGNVHTCLIADSVVSEVKTSKWVRIFSSEDHISTLISSLTFSRSGQRLAVATADLRVHVIDYQGGDEGSVVVNFACPSVVHTISFFANEKSLLICGQQFSMVTTFEDASDGKKSKTISGKSHCSFSLPYSNSIVGSSITGPGQVVIARRRWDDILASLPDAIPKKHFGT